MLPSGSSQLMQLKVQYGEGGVMFWTCTVGNKIRRPFKINDGIKINIENNCKFFDKTF